MIQFGPEVCSNLPLAMTAEWMETNGLGGFASSTVVGLNTRRYHGLLTAALKPPGGRTLLLSKLEEVLLIGSKRYELSANQYPGIIHPQGQQFLKNFRLDPFPIFTYVVEGIEIEKSVFMVHGQNTTAVQYKLRLLDTTANNWPPPHHKKIYLELFPLIAFRDYHRTTHENNDLNPYVETYEHLATMHPYAGLEELNLSHDADHVESTGYWYRNFEYVVERERGLDYREDLFNPLVMKFDLGQRATAAVIASLQPYDIGGVDKLRQDEIKRRQATVTRIPFKDDFMRKLVLAGDQFIVERGIGKTIIAGYPWFGDWGRDALVALPGLTLATGRVEDAKSILGTFAQYISQGLVPNYFSDQDDQPQYNSVDATLWFFEAVRSLSRYTGDYEFIRKNFYEAMREMVDWYVQGTRFGIGADSDGLLSCGQGSVQLTWMDAKVGDWVVTPRHGKPVEVQALWFNALCIMQYLAKIFEDHENQAYYASLAARVKESFNRLFWNDSKGCLYDVVNGQTVDTSLRPNQIFAVSLNYSMLSLERAKSVVRVVAQELLTPYGLRTLSPNDARYRGRYQGDVVSRDWAYHQGTAWPWLIGPFISAYIKVNGRSEQARIQAADWLTGLYRHLQEVGLGTISEIFDGDAPHLPRGCIAQAWSVAELIRIGVEDIYDIRSAEDWGVNFHPHSRI